MALTGAKQVTTVFETLYGYCALLNGRILEKGSNDLSRQWKHNFLYRDNFNGYYVILGIIQIHDVI